MIPKVINYCWFGKGKLSKLNKKCIRSWKIKCPDYKIVRWDENNFDINNCPRFVKEAYIQNEWAFVSDYARLAIIYNNGGIYLDTDVELLRDITPIVDKYSSFMGFEDSKFVASGLGFGAEKGNKLIKEMMYFYNDKVFNKNEITEITCPIVNTGVLKKHGLKLNGQSQLIDNMMIFSTEYFCPKNIYTGKTTVTNNSFSIHHYNASWQSPINKFKLQAIITIKKFLPSKIVNTIRYFIRTKRKNG